MSRGERYGRQSLKETGYELPSPPPVQSHKMSLVPPALNCDNAYERLSTRDAH